MPQVPLPAEVNLEPQLVIGVDHLVREGILEVSPVAHLVGADENPVRGLEPAALALDLQSRRQAGRAAAAQDVGRGHPLPVVELGDLVVEEAHRGRVGEQPVAVLLAPLDVAGLVGAVSVLAVVEDALICYLPCEDLEVVDPPLGLGVEAGSRWVVLEVGVGRLLVWLWLWL